MAMWACRRCGTLYSVGASYCPQCTSTDCEEWDGMAKISKAQGPSYGEGAPENPTAVGGADVLEQVSQVTETPAPAEDGPTEDVAPYGEWLNEDLSNELASRELPYSGSKAEMVARLEEDDRFKAEQESQA